METGKSFYFNGNAYWLGIYAEQSNLQPNAGSYGAVDLTVKMWVTKEEGYGMWSDAEKPWQIRMNNSYEKSGTWVYNFQNKDTFDVGSYTVKRWYLRADGTRTVPVEVMVQYTQGVVRHSFEVVLKYDKPKPKPPEENGLVFIGTSSGPRRGQVYINVGGSIRKAKAVYIGTASGPKKAK